MGESEMAICDFCQEEKTVERTYFYPSKYKKPDNTIESCKLYNEGNYFVFVRTCKDCGEPKTLKQK